MMEVKYRGTPPDEVVWWGECRACKSVVKAATADLQVRHCQKDGTWGEAACPVCGKLMWFYKEKK